MTVKELIKELEKYNPDAKILTITVGNMNEWHRTDKPKVSAHKTMFGETVFIN